MRAALLGLLVAFVAAAPAAAAKVDVMVVGKAKVLHKGRVAARDVHVTAGGRRCRVAARTPLALLVRTGLRTRVRDYGSCSSSERDAAGLFVTRVGPDRNRGRDGWVYKTGRTVSSRGAGDPGSRTGARLMWFWCVTGLHGCQRTLAATPETSQAAPGSILRVTVRGYDDVGKSVHVAGATVTLAGATATTGADGVASLTVPDAPGRRRVVAARDGMVRSFAEAVTIG